MKSQHFSVTSVRCESALLRKRMELEIELSAQRPHRALCLDCKGREEVSNAAYNVSVTVNSQNEHYDKTEKYSCTLEPLKNQYTSFLRPCCPKPLSESYRFLQNSLFSFPVITEKMFLQLL